jgi:DNA-binding NtrC family response regulator
MIARALVLDDDPVSREALVERLGMHGFEAHGADTLEAARREIELNRFDLVLLDLQLPDGNGLELLRALEEHPLTEIIFVTGHASVDTAVEAFRGGAVDYLTKPIDTHRLKVIAQNVMRTLELHREIHALRDELRRLGHFGRIVGRSPPMQRIYDLVERVAWTDSTVLLVGETGTGKDLVAETIHALSPRAAHPMVPVNCGALSASLIESELFGHERGSFTGAEKAHRGVFERAHGGTLFLDEITEMPLELQVKLLRILESGTVTRLGSDRPRPIDVRLIAATNRDPRQALADGKLREDLLYRVLVFPIELPPLRDRSDDIELLAGYFLESLNGKHQCTKKFAGGALEPLRNHDWPGNVRELKHVVERAFIMAGDKILARDIPLAVTVVAPPQANGCEVAVGISIAEAERRLVLATLDSVAGDKKRAADILGISLKTLYNRLNVYKGPFGVAG